MAEGAAASIVVCSPVDIGGGGKVRDCCVRSIGVSDRELVDEVVAGPNETDFPACPKKFLPLPSLDNFFDLIRLSISYVILRLIKQSVLVVFQLTTEVFLLLHSITGGSLI